MANEDSVCHKWKERLDIEVKRSDSTAEWDSKAESKNFLICLFRALSEFDHNASVARSLGFSLPFASSAIPLTGLFTTALLSERLSGARDEPSLEIKVTVTKSKIITASHTARQDTELAWAHASTTTPYQTDPRLNIQILMKDTERQYFNWLQSESGRKLHVYGFIAIKQRLLLENADAF